MRTYLYIYILLHFCNIIWASAPKNNFENYQLGLKRTTCAIKLDGILDESTWQTADSAHHFFQKFPNDTSYAKSQTTVMLSYDDHFIYVAAICYDDLKGDYVISSLKRDWSYPVNDAFAVLIDPFNDKTNGFSFGVNAMGAQREGLVEFGGQQGVTTAWDNKWYSEVKHYPTKWIVEMAIPFKTLRYKVGINNWGINFSRNDLKRNENSVWAPIPYVYNVATLTYNGKLVWDEAPKSAGTNISIIPYVTSNVSRNYLNTSETKPSLTYNGGLDAKIAISSSLNLDLTINPDFSQVEVDRQVTNLTRFNLFFPERRTFFLENSDLFGRFGFIQIRPFFSRQIGLKDGNIIPIVAGARLSGKINKNWRLGAMNMQTAKASSLNVDAQNYTVVALQRQVFEKSNIAAIVVNRQAFNDTLLNKNDFNRIVGLDYNLLSKNNKWQGKFFYHYALVNFNANDNYSQAVWLVYNTRVWHVGWNHEYVGKNYITDVGFTPRLYNFDISSNSIQRISYWRFEPYAYYKFYPKSSIINNHGPGFYSSYYTDKYFKTNDVNYSAQYVVHFQSQATAQLNLNHNYTQLYFDTDITQSRNKAIPKGNYTYQDIKLMYTSSPRKKFTYSGSIDYGDFYIARKLSVATELNYRIQPYGIISIAYNRDEIIMPADYINRYFDLIGPRFELSFTRNFFLTTFLQYNKQIDNVNVNTRLQWRFAPMSDLYIVYGDNYYANDFTKKNKTLVIKLNYWFGL